MRNKNYHALMGTMLFLVSLTGCTSVEATYYTVGQQMVFVSPDSSLLANYPMKYVSYNNNIFVFKQRLDYYANYTYQMVLPSTVTSASVNDVEWQKNDEHLLQFSFKENKASDFVIKFIVSDDFLLSYNPLLVYPYAEKAQSANDKTKYIVRLSLIYKPAGQ